MRAGRFRGEKKVKNGFCLQRAVNNSRKAFLRVRDFAGLKTVAHFGGSCGVTADGARWAGARGACGWRAGIGGAGGWRATIVFSSLELTYFGKRNIYQAKWACGS